MPVEPPDDVYDLLPPSWQRWGLGVFAAALLVAYGVSCFITGHALLPAQGSDYDLTGGGAVAIGIVSLGVGFGLHFTYVWESHRRLCYFAGIGKVVALLAIVGGFGYVLVTEFVKF